MADTPFDTFIHAARLFRYNVTDVQKQLLDLAIIVISEILKFIKIGAPSVMVLITLSFAAILHASNAIWLEYTYSEEDWNPTTNEQALIGSGPGYVGKLRFLISLL
ncbi:hypothetical protein B0J12DRAFT_701225 [Macrophomina phaseolina]|uniref:Uncharacterized protein n=1 Tax=Macrophomina phaseolina TaxID=35725 RepID=A0ABQ8G4Y1_9PEZI|nr:hypothetical protein B0J12DRAFT_701225 [Macrophomina phaseolina]